MVEFKTPGEGRRCGRSAADSAICLMHNNLSSDTVYYFGVVAYNASGSSQMSDVVHCHTLADSQSTLPSTLPRPSVCLSVTWSRQRVYETVERPSVRPSVCPIDRQQQQRRAASLLLSALQTGYIDR